MAQNPATGADLLKYMYKIVQLYRYRSTAVQVPGRHLHGRLSPHPYSVGFDFMYILLHPLRM
jgi:hypothetical protein